MILLIFEIGLDVCDCHDLACMFYDSGDFRDMVWFFEILVILVIVTIWRRFFMILVITMI